jgi:ABC-2 type transport system ATP-binding protein
VIEAPVATGAVLSVDRLCKTYRATVAVDGISFGVAPGEIVGLLGPNGAGKTTTINMILGVLEPTSGSVKIEGIDVAKRRAQALARANFAAVHAPLPGNLTVQQNLRFFGLIYRVERLSMRIEELLAQFELAPFRHTKCGLLSSGEQTRVGLAKAMLNQPRLLLLDEPTASLDPAVARDTRAMIRAIARAGTAVLWTSHNMVEVTEVCDRVLFLSHGRILLEGDPKQLPAAHGKQTLEELFITVAREPLTLEI